MSGEFDNLRDSERLLPRWANEQDSWVRAIVHDVLVNPCPCSDADIERYLKVLLAETKLADDTFEPVPPVEEKPLDDNALDPVRLNSLKIGEGVNALKPGTQIDFAPRVTVIFGENGSGKSGFVRVLKRAAGVRTAEDILPNIWAAKQSSPSAVFTVTVGTSEKTVDWKNESGISPLNRVNVFDTRGARLHLEEDLTYVYTPGELMLYPLVQNAIERVRTALSQAISARTPGANTLQQFFDPSSSIYPLIATLGGATDLEEIRRYAALPDRFESTIESLKAEIEALKSSNTQNELKRLQARRAMVEALSSAIDVARAFDLERYAELLDAYTRNKERRDKAGAKAFEGLGIPGALSEEWRNFIQSGEHYVKTHFGDGYPSAEDSCAYCRQPLSDAAVALIKKYRDFMNNDIRTAVDQAEKALRDYIAPITPLEWHGLRARFDQEVDGKDFLAPVGSVIDQTRSLAEGVAGGRAITWLDKDHVLSEAERIIAVEAERLDALIVNLQASVEQRDAELKKKQSELVELEAKRTTKTLLPQIEQRVINDRWVTRASGVRSGISGILKTLTETAKQASEEILNKGFEKRFQQECRKLRAPNVTLHFPGRQGQVARRKTIAAYRPSQILSEGEQKALALADFLAEVMAIPAASPVIFDDPITSMDYRRIREVAEQIVALAEVHQVIVFTHNIWFAALLLSSADKKTWKYYDIRSERGETGLISAAEHPRVDSISRVRGRINRLIDAAEEAEGEARADLVEKGYETLRGLCELVVEHELLQGVVQRYAPQVMMTRLEKINVPALGASVATVLSVFEKACRYIASHSQPIETQGLRPTLEELKEDFASVLKAREPHMN